MGGGGGRERGRVPGVGLQAQQLLPCRLAQPLVRPVCKACGESLLVLQDTSLKRLGLHPKHAQLPSVITLPSQP